MQWENTLDTFAVTDASDCESLIEHCALSSDHDPRKNLDSLLFTLLHFCMHAHAVADVEFGNILFHLLLLNLVDDVHGLNAVVVERDGRTSLIRDSRNHIFSIRAWKKSSTCTAIFISWEKLCVRLAGLWSVMKC